MAYFFPICGRRKSITDFVHQNDIFVVVDYFFRQIFFHFSRLAAAVSRPKRDLRRNCLRTFASRLVLDLQPQQVKFFEKKVTKVKFVKHEE